LFAFLFEDCPGGVRAEDMLKAMGKPLGVVIKADFPIKVKKTLITTDDIKPNTVLELA
jgi:hypothetical protein